MTLRTRTDENERKASFCVNRQNGTHCAGRASTSTRSILQIAVVVLVFEFHFRLIQRNGKQFSTCLRWSLPLVTYSTWSVARASDRPGMNLTLRVKMVNIRTNHSYYFRSNSLQKSSSGEVLYTYVLRVLYGPNSIWLQTRTKSLLSLITEVTKTNSNKTEQNCWNIKFCCYRHCIGSETWKSCVSASFSIFGNGTCIYWY